MEALDGLVEAEKHGGKAFDVDGDAAGVVDSHGRGLGRLHL